MFEVFTISGKYRKFYFLIIEKAWKVEDKI